jgi:hypothetical protein
MEKEFHFVYVTTNLINGKQYVGEHSTNDMDCRKTKKYTGSGLYIDNAKKLYGRKNFERKDLEFFPTKKEAFNAQEKYIQQYGTLNPDGYNISPKGGNWGGIKGCASEDTKRKMRVPKSKEHKEHMSLAWIERRKTPVSTQTREKLGKAREGKTHDQNSKDKIGYANTIRVWKDESRLNLSKKRSSTHHSEKTKELIGKKIPCKYCGKEMNAGNLARYHNENCVFKFTLQNVDELHQ